MVKNLFEKSSLDKYFILTPKSSESYHVMPFSMALPTKKPCLGRGFGKHLQHYASKGIWDLTIDGKVIVFYNQIQSVRQFSSQKI